MPNHTFDIVVSDSDSSTDRELDITIDYKKWFDDTSDYTVFAKTINYDLIEIGSVSSKISFGEKEELI